MASVTGTGSTSSTTSTSSASNAQKAFVQNFDTFLKLLTTQLKNQDPLNPMDSKDFTQQLVQYSGVEQGINTNKNLETLISMYQTNQNASMASYIGLNVIAKGDTASLANGSAQWGYTTPLAAQNSKISVYNSSGTLVWQGTGDATAGDHTFTWDGKDLNGVQQPAGLYRIAVTGSDTTGKSYTAQTAVNGTVDGIENDNGTNYLTIGKLKIAMNDVISIRAPSN